MNNLDPDSHHDHNVKEVLDPDSHHDHNVKEVIVIFGIVFLVYGLIIAAYTFLNFLGLYWVIQNMFNLLN